jgi:hypothetical protein
MKPTILTITKGWNQARRDSNEEITLDAYLSKQIEHNKDAFLHEKILQDLHQPCIETYEEFIEDLNNENCEGIIYRHIAVGYTQWLILTWLHYQMINLEITFDESISLFLEYHNFDRRYINKCDVLEIVSQLLTEGQIKFTKEIKYLLQTISIDNLTNRSIS